MIKPQKSFSGYTYSYILYVSLYIERLHVIENHSDMFITVLTWKTAGYMPDIFRSPIHFVCNGGTPQGSSVVAGQITII